MFSKLLVATAALSSTEALKIKLGGVQENCSFNIERMTSAHARGDFAKYSHSSSPYKDPEFPGDESSLFWR